LYHLPVLLYRQLELGQRPELLCLWLGLLERQCQQQEVLFVRRLCRRSKRPRARSWLRQEQWFEI
jgi:hypothetical protein